MAMTPKVSTGNSSVAPETAGPHRIRQKQLLEREQQHLRPLPPYNYSRYYEHESIHQQNASPSKQQSTPSPSVTLSSPKLSFRESLRESFRDLYVPKIWSNLRKSASEISLVLEAMRSGPALQAHEAPTSSGAKVATISDNSTKSTRGLAVQKRKRRNAIVAWQNYSPHHLNKQLRYGN
uniref:Uncharacterized protein n=1 Tax=Setaria digitata TaxID=48799 RepID=A0A915Q1B2_9BILA